MTKFLMFCTSLITSLIFNTILFAQEPPIKWGEIPKKDLEMKSFLQDSNATAVILCDYGESSFGDQMNMIYYRHLRVKILTNAGYEWGTFDYVNPGSQTLYINIKIPNGFEIKEKLSNRT